jgi:hypothetical protein
LLEGESALKLSDGGAVDGSASRREAVEPVPVDPDMSLTIVYVE